MLYDILIVGGGHAGVEAAHIASQFKELKVALVSLPGVGLASAPCNPSVGGVGKGQVVRELDSMGGFMGKLADLSGLQFRTLNESKGHAVQSTRVQIDKIKYSLIAEELLSKIQNLTIIHDEIVSVIEEGSEYKVIGKSSTWNSKKLIFTVGTFLAGKMHIGEDQIKGGREGCVASATISDFFKDINKVKARFKTGTPARINKNTIDYSKLEEQPSDSLVECFHYGHKVDERFVNQVSCYLAHTNSETMSIIRSNKERSPMFNGQVKAVGARYCPSIEDKAYRYPDKDIHHVFVEPEGEDMDTMYPSGMSTSLPRDVQDSFISSMVGLEKAEIINYGYAVEYDVLDTTQLTRCLELKKKPGVYFAGQVNGTSGYEEAAGQGFIAGANAALSILGKEPLIIDRSESYIGVMVEDLVSNTRDEPYRLFTARSENRLSIREDNTVLRMAKYRTLLGLSNEVDTYNDKFVGGFDDYKNFLSECFVSASSSCLKGVDVKVPRRTSLADIIRQSNEKGIDNLKTIFKNLNIEIPHRLLKTIAISVKYDGYIAKSVSASVKTTKLDSKKLDVNSLLMSDNISFECKQRIKLIEPETFGQLRLIEGIRPASLAVIAGIIN